MKTSNRRTFLGVVGGTLATASLASGAAGTPASAAQPLTSLTEDARRERLAQALRELNEAAGIGITSDEFERARVYVTGVHAEARAKLSPLVLREDLDLPVHFSAKRRP